MAFINIISWAFIIGTTLAILRPDNVTPERVVQGQFPYMASVRVIDRDRENANHHAGGAIISPYFVLTTVHGLRRSTGQLRSKDDILIYVGTVHIDISIQSLIHVDQIFEYSQYDSSDKFLNDIALIKTKEKIIFRDFVQSVSFTQRPCFGIDVKFTGFGPTSLNKPDEMSATLNVYETETYQSNEECRRALVNNPDSAAQVRDKTICIKNKRGWGTTTGDSGGPLVKKENKVLCGLASLACKPYGEELPSIFTDVSSYIGWIQDTMRRNGKNIPENENTLQLI